MTWNYRVTRQHLNEEDHYAIREVYYDEQGEIRGWTEKGVGVSGGSLADLQGDLLYYIRAISEPVLDLDELEKNVLDCKREEESK